MKRVTIDSSVIVASLLQKDSHHQKALKIWKEVLEGRKYAIMPFSVLVEVVAAIRRRTGSEKLADEVKNELLNADNITFVMIDEKAGTEAADIATKTGLRGMDAIVVQVARDYDAELITFDNEMLKKAKPVLKRTY